MAEPLFPVVETPDVSGSMTYDSSYRRSVKWDFEKGDFVRDGANRMVECDGREAYITWCFKIVQTERNRCLAYPDSIGTEMERAMEDDDGKTVESMVQRTITDALMVNPRTEYVRDFVFDWNGDVMKCQFKVKGVGWNEEFSIDI